MLDTWPVDNKQYKVSTNQGETFVIEMGSRDNPPLMLLHGSTSNSYCWLGDVEALSESYNVYAIDIIGEAGFSENQRPTYESGVYAVWLNAVMEKLHLKKTNIVGLSLGGWMALDFATTHPEKVSSLFLMCAGGIYKEKKSFIFKAVLLSLFGKRGTQNIMKMLNGGVLPDQNEPGLKLALDYTALVSKHFKPRTANLSIFTEDKLKALTMPVLAVYGDNDCILNGKESLTRLGAHLSNVKTVLLANTGHIITDQAGSILAFLKECS